MSNGVAANLAEITLELTGSYLINAFFACALSKKPTLLMFSFSSPDQMKSPFDISPFPVYRTFEIPIMSYLKRFISFLRISSFPAAYRVCTFYVPTVRVFLASFSLCVFTAVCLVLACFPVANFSTLPWLLGRGLGPFWPGRHPSWYGFVWCSFRVVFFRLFILQAAVSAPLPPNTPPLSGLVTGTEIATVRSQWWSSD